MPKRQLDVTHSTVPNYTFINTSAPEQNYNVNQAASDLRKLQGPRIWAWLAALHLCSLQSQIQIAVRLNIQPGPQGKHLKNTKRKEKTQACTDWCKKQEDANAYPNKRNKKRCISGRFQSNIGQSSEETEMDFYFVLTLIWTQHKLSHSCSKCQSDHSGNIVWQCLLCAEDCIAFTAPI